MLKNHYKKLRNNKHIAKFSKCVGAENIWLFNTVSVNKAIALGIACSWIPMPFHTTIALFLAILIDCNVFVVSAAIWFANPITMPFMYYSAYKLGCLLLNEDTNRIYFSFKIEDLLLDFHEIWQPLLLGCAVLGILCGLLAYVILQLIPHTRNKR